LKTGKLIIFSAPSGSGKTTIVKHLLNQEKLSLSFSVSATSRSPRKGEVDGKDYFFLTKKIFKKKIKNDEFLEYEEVYPGSFYGTLKKEINRIRDLGKNVIFDIDVIGGLNIKNKYPDQTLSIFLKAPNINDIKKRLIKRNLDLKNMLKLRIDKIHEEIKLAEKFDVSLLNTDLNEAKLKAEKLIMNFIKD
jgi:guanylate kinase